MKIYLMILIVVSFIAMSGCAESGGGAATPTGVLKSFVGGLKDKDAVKVKAALSKNSMTMLESAAKAKSQTLDEFITSRNASEGLKVEDEYRNEKIEGDTATVEAKSGDKWETMHFVKEDGWWKLALDKG